MIRPLDKKTARKVLDNLREWDKKEVIAGCGLKFRKEALATLMAQHHKWSYSLNNVPVAVIGGSFFDDLYMAYMLTTDRFPKISPGLTRAVVSTIMPIVADSPASRAECLSLPGHHEAHGWLRRLGAKPVELVTGIGRQGEDFIRWRWTRDDVYGRNAIRQLGRDRESGRG